MRKLFVLASSVATTFLLANAAMAHTPLFSCYDSGGAIQCEGGFSDGSSAAGVVVHLLDGDGKTIKDLKLDENSEVTFEKPASKYSVQFDAGEGHRIDVAGEDIAE
jgi:hypothetical protein